MDARIEFMYLREQRRRVRFRLSAGTRDADVFVLRYGRQGEAKAPKQRPRLSARVCRICFDFDIALTAALARSSTNRLPTAKVHHSAYERLRTVVVTY